MPPPSASLGAHWTPKGDAAFLRQLTRQPRVGSRPPAEQQVYGGSQPSIVPRPMQIGEANADPSRLKKRAPDRGRDRGPAAGKTERLPEPPLWGGTTKRD